MGSEVELENLDIEGGVEEGGGLGSIVFGFEAERKLKRLRLHAAQMGGGCENNLERSDPVRD
jgi:hypothetical protein